MRATTEFMEWRFGLTDVGWEFTGDVQMGRCADGGNHLNIALDNLQLISRTQVMLKSYSDGIRERIGWTRKGVQIEQFTVDGVFIGIYPSIKQASVATGIDNASVYRTVIGEYKQYKDFIFKEVK